MLGAESKYTVPKLMRIMLESRHSCEGRNPAPGLALDTRLRGYDASTKYLETTGTMH